MPKRKIGRREFLKLAIASAAAAGLSHFHILNIGGADVALAQWDDCTNDAAGGSTDICAVGASPDTCPEPWILNGDICNVNDPDFCNPDDSEPDLCDPPNSPDVCDPVDITQDNCTVPPVDDTCEMNPAPQQPDTCDPGAGDPDVCDPGNLNPDVCPDPPPGDGDVCSEFYPEQDFCYVTGGEDLCPGPPPESPDSCQPGAGNPDDPNPVTVGSVGVESASSILPSLGGVAAALGAAALWLRHRLRPEKSEEPETE